MRRSNLTEKNTGSGIMWRSLIEAVPAHKEWRKKMKLLSFIMARRNTIMRSPSDRLLRVYQPTDQRKDF